MNRIKTTDISKIVNDRQCIAAKMLMVLLVLCTTFCLTVQAQNTPLNEDSAVEFKALLAADLMAAVGDEATVDSITEAWETKNLVGKTKAQAIDILVAAVRAAVDDPTIATGLRIKWVARWSPAPSRVNPTTASPTAPSNPTTASPTAPSNPQPAAVTLDSNSATSFKQLLAADLNAAVGDEATANSIREAWASRNLVGKTQAQAIDLLVADVRGFVDEPTIAVGLRIKWLAKIRPPASPTAQTTQPTQPTQPTNKPSSAKLEIRSDSPLSDAEMDQVMAWIATKTSAKKLPFCYKQTQGRTAGVPLDSNCPAGTEQNGLLCYPKCSAGSSGAGPVCWKTCPSGFADAGAFCQKPESYGRGAGYAIWDKPICERDNPQGCEQNAALIYPNCRPGFHTVGANTCSPDCPPGFADTGTGCAKPSQLRTAGNTLSCKSGTIKDGLLCYPPCEGNFNGKGPLCWQQCPSHHPVDCGAGCATNGGECAADVQKKALSVVNAAVSLITLGTGSVSQLGNLANTIGHVEKIITAGGQLADAAGTIKGLVESAANDYAVNFAVLTSEDVDNQLRRAFSVSAANYIKVEYAKRHIQLTWPATAWNAIESILSLAALKDPTGLATVALAFADPVCDKDMVLPRVQPRY